MLTLSSEYWDYYGRLLNLTPMADKRVIYSFHAYGFPQDKFAMGPIQRVDRR